MDKLADKAHGMADKTLGKDKSSQPGSGVERAADNFANDRTCRHNSHSIPCRPDFFPFFRKTKKLTIHSPTETDSIGDKAGVPDKYNDTIHKGVDSKINDKIPGGN